MGAGEVAEVKSTGCSSRGPGSVPTTYSGSQPPVTTAPGESNPSFGLCRQCMHTVLTYLHLLGRVTESLQGLIFSLLKQQAL